MRNLVVLFLLLIAMCSNAESVTSTLDGGVIKTLPKLGQTVKKGEALVVFYQTGINADIDAAKAKIKEAKSLLAAKQLDRERAIKLVGRAMSKNDLEEAIYEVISAESLIEEKEATLRKLEFDKAYCSLISAPCDYKVTKVYLTENSGTYIGAQIIDVEQVNN